MNPDILVSAEGDQIIAESLCGNSVWVLSCADAMSLSSTLMTKALSSMIGRSLSSDTHTRPAREQNFLRMQDAAELTDTDVGPEHDAYYDMLDRSKELLRRLQICTAALARIENPGELEFQEGPRKIARDALVSVLPPTKGRGKKR